MISGRRFFILLYTASGAAALVYEVAWTRLLTLQLGHTVAAASTVLAALMGGLAIGAWLAGRTLARGEQCDSLALSPLKGELAQDTPVEARATAARLRAYAALEIGVAVCALLLPLVLHLSVPALAWAYADGMAPARFAIVRIVISLTLVGLPAAAMGATFPIAVSWFTHIKKRGRESFAPADAGLLYAANTAGAALGAITAGFWLIPAIGLRGTTWIGVALNLGAAGGALGISTRATAEDAEDAEARTPTEKIVTAKKKGPLRPPRLVSAPSPRLAWIAVTISGFAALVYEVAWTRLLALVIGPTTYAFATMAAAFISGLALGSAAGTRLARRTAQPTRWLALMLIVSAMASTVAAWFTATRMPLVVAAQVADPAVAFAHIVLSQALTVGLLLLPATLALGATFPLALTVAAGSISNVGRDAARVYAANTLGAIAGALAGGFLLIPLLGLRLTFETAAIVATATGAACLGAADQRPTTNDQRPTTNDQRPRWPTRRAVAIPLAVAGAAIAAVLALPSWDRELLSSGAYKYAPYLSAADFDTVLRAGRLDYYKEGAAATVTVRRLAGTLSLAIDGKVDASNAGDMLTQRLLGLLPVLLHGHAEEVCVIGLGSGVTVGSALAPGTVHRLDVVEISPEVVEASHFFDRENGDALRQPAVRLIVGDGRSHLLLTPRRYDVIVSEPSNPWMAGVATLFTREFFEAANARLKPDGLLCQWAHTYDISAADLRSIVRTFQSVFPRGTMWLVGEGDLLLIGPAADTSGPRLDEIASGCCNGTTAATLATVGVADAAAVPFDVLSLFAGGPRELARYGDKAMIQTDDRTALEYSAPRGIYGRTTGENAAAVRALVTEQPPAVRAAFATATDASWTSRGTMELKAEAYALAYDAFQRALAMNSRNVTALAGLSDAAAGARRQSEERDWLTALAAKEPGNAAVRVELSRLLAAAGDFPSAIAAANDALRLAPDDPRAVEQLASILADAGDADRLAPLADALLARFPERPDGRYYHATALFMRGRTEEALAAARQVVDGRPDHARAQNLLGAACATLGRVDCARTAFQASIRANPRDPATYVNLGLFYLQSGDPRSAVTYFAEALTIDPQSTSAHNGLAQARSLLAGNPR